MKFVDDDDDDDESR